VVAGAAGTDAAVDGALAAVPLAIAEPERPLVDAQAARTVKAATQARTAGTARGVRDITADLWAARAGRRGQAGLR
jgi:hypothetical protein